MELCTTSVEGTRFGDSVAYRSFASGPYHLRSFSFLQGLRLDSAFPFSSTNHGCHNFGVPTYRSQQLSTPDAGIR